MLLAPRLYDPNAPARIEAEPGIGVETAEGGIWPTCMMRSTSASTTAPRSRRPASGQATQVPRILVSAAASVTESLNQFQPMIAPTIACDWSTPATRLGHPVDRQRRRERRRERPRQRVHRPELAQRVRRTGAADHRPQEGRTPLHTSGRRHETDHPGSDRRAEHVGRVVGAQRPAQEQTAGQKKKNRSLQTGPPTDEIKIRPNPKLERVLPTGCA